MNTLIARYRDSIYQFSRFAGIGFLNTALDFILINIFIAASGITMGGGLSALKVLSFSLAVIHSYYWNQSWAFVNLQEHFLGFLVKIAAAGGIGLLAIAAAVYGAGAKYGIAYFIVIILAFFVCEVVLWKAFGLRRAAGGGRSGQQFGLFMTISVIGALLSAAIVWFITSQISPLFDTSPRLWANIANAVATIIVLFWNFVGYKVFVFRK